MKLEYKILHIPAARILGTGLPDDLGQRFDELGNQGWELVKVESILRGGIFGVGGSNTVAFIAFFKRPKT